MNQTNLRAIKSFKPYLKPTTEVGYHFNLKGHSTKKHFKIAIFKSNVQDVKERLSIEIDLIHLIDGYNGPIINSLIPSQNKIKKTCFS
jgi:hypothetical protein